MTPVSLIYRSLALRCRDDFDRQALFRQAIKSATKALVNSFQGE